MNKKHGKTFILIFIILILSACSKSNNKTEIVTKQVVMDSSGAEVTVPESVENIICSGPGALRYLTYMQCEDKVIAVDDIEVRRDQFDARPYAYANPQFRGMPVFGEFRGADNPELIVSLEPLPDIIFKTYAEMGHNPVELNEKTGIPVVVLEYGDIGRNKGDFYRTLDIIGLIMDKEERAEEIKAFLDSIIQDLDSRTNSIKERKMCYLGGVAYKGPHGLQSTEPGYPPFVFLNTPNAAISSDNSNLQHMDVSKESIVEWDPDIIFIDLSTYQLESEASALYEIRNDPVYKNLKAVKSGNVFGVLPYNWYTQNHGSTLANAYFIGKVLYPEKFEDIDPAEKADEIYEFLVGKPVFEEMSEAFGSMVFKKIEL
jgi:iron complex transport system substrate-binding protein